jgi:hypothetical protein
VRPKNKQATQYVKFAMDIIHDLEIDQPHTEGLPNSPLSTEQLENIRTYLACYYIISA